MKVLFLISKLGFGHIRAAKAVEQALYHSHDGVDCEYLDLWSLMDDKVAAAVKDGYLRMTRDHPEYYQKLYDLDKGVWQQLSGESPLDEGIKQFLIAQQERWFPHPTRWLPLGKDNIDTVLLNSLVNLLTQQNDIAGQKIILRSLLLLIRTMLLSRMQERIETYNPDVVVATQMYPAALFSRLKQKQAFSHIPSLGVVTDYGLQKVWVRPTTDSYCVACQAVAEQLVRWGVPAQQIYETGIPLDSQFSRPPSQAVARQSLGLEGRRPTLLITGGEYGIGLAPIVAELCRASGQYQILVTAGNAGNEKSALDSLRATYPQQVVLFDWVENMAELIAAADVVVGKPGGLSVSEALACGRPFFATCSLGGQEAHNVTFLRNNAVGDQLSGAQLVTRLQQLFEEPELLAAMQYRAAHVGHRDAAQQVARLVCQSIATPDLVAESGETL